MTKEARKYYREINTLIPSKGDCGKSVLSNIKMRIAEIESSTANLTYDMLCEILGEPKTVITDYYGIVDIDYLVKKLRFARLMRICSYVALIAIIVCSVTVAAYYRRAYISFNNQIIEQNNREILN